MSYQPKWVPHGPESPWAQGPMGRRAPGVMDAWAQGPKSPWAHGHLGGPAGVPGRGPGAGGPQGEHGGQVIPKSKCATENVSICIHTFFPGLTASAADPSSTYFRPLFDFLTTDF